ncbi:MAG: UvrD-helicase domain-containing protein [Deltaproteobacteria bacterium]|nr:UvrD-helicase domain-containing protein [Candidatus Anaeroferrophillus wilburensis]MBN2889637.1 UvrD-helicase domain-containing protein [Deltaproteobacteria bacterium]
MKTEPFNPYVSFTISAAAGSGKTYQLAGRYLHLVAAGARLEEIVCCTFTNKAAEEMKNRIIDNALQLLADPEAQQLFDAQMNRWAAAAEIAVGYPRTAAQTAGMILESSETIQVVTIDAFFSSLARQYAPELGLPPEAEIADALTVEDLKQEVWQELSRVIYHTPGLQQDYEAYLQATTGRGGHLCRHYIEQLHQQRSELQAYGCTITEALDKLLLEEPSIDAVRQQFYLAAIAVLTTFGDDPAFLPYRETFAEPLAAAIASLRHDQPLPEIAAGLIQAGLLTTIDFSSYHCPDRFSLSKGRLRRAEIKALIDECNLELANALRPYRQALLIPIYNRTLRLISTLYDIYATRYKKLKQRLKLLEFSDLGPAAMELWSAPAWEGIRFHLLSGIRHLLLDEFQDTSRLQWDVFRHLLNEAMLTGESIFADFSLFLVGDEKQSIYAFRNADYRVLADAEKAASHHPRAISHPLNDSFRSSTLLLDFINRLFATVNQHHPDTIPFTPHNRHPDTWPLTGGSLTLYHPCRGTDDEELPTSGISEEALFVADTINRLLADHRPLVREAINGTIVQRRITPGDITILYRKRQGINRLLHELTSRQIPAVREDEGGFFQQPEIRDCMALISLMADPADDLALLRLLHSPLNRQPVALTYELMEHRLAADGTSLLHDYLATGEKSALARALTSTVLKNQGLPLGQRVALFQEITAARQCYQRHSNDRRPAANLDRFLSLIASSDYHSAIEARVHLQKLQHADDLSGSLGEQQHAVRLMTIHRAKGLQNHVIFLFNTAAGMRTDNGMVINRGLSRDQFPLLFLPQAKEDLPPVDFLEEMQQINLQENFREEMRVLYVALTRATQHLFITSNGKEDTEQPEILQFMAASLAAMGAATVDLWGEPCLAGMAAPHPQPAAAMEPAARSGSNRERLSLDPEVLRSFRRLGRRTPSGEPAVPPPIETGQASGSDRLLGLIVHRVLEEELKGLTPSLSAICQAWAPADQREAYREKAAIMLTRIRQHHDYLQLKEQPAAAEVSVSSLDSSGRYLLGRLDVLLADGQQAVALDFKTGGTDQAQLIIYRDLLAEIFPQGRVAVLQAKENAKETQKPFEIKW